MPVKRKTYVIIICKLSSNVTLRSVIPAVCIRLMGRILQSITQLNVSNRWYVSVTCWTVISNLISLGGVGHIAGTASHGWVDASCSGRVYRRYECSTSIR